jgi:hypothetical protein
MTVLGELLKQIQVVEYCDAKLARLKPDGVFGHSTLTSTEILEMLSDSSFREDVSGLALSFFELKREVEGKKLDKLMQEYAAKS